MDSQWAAAWFLPAERPECEARGAAGILKQIWMSDSGRFLPVASSALLVKSDANGGQRQCNWAVKCDAITHGEDWDWYET
ncbi:TPA: hypothetical protein L5D37_003675 [Pseudomonas aeruginosa]|uniref:hypothetical protein n=1 Tax=Pseudomonas aeruginosa TaxID=287 RepID=UPI0011E6023E|nr:hypothetical protein [Pseudomonas aeruginosa]MCO3670591.1 hypothetical protein [Pseudomonas aeruginosa]HBO9019086.1 hypothetical protein [Pseudomonas aeruginosa]HEH9487699.1 hypothetical protein [Pseudomonas aeruginosa]